ncbi:MAG: TetR/AcrR family transcriptional regulator [Oscillospiraceae bacterium]
MNYSEKEVTIFKGVLALAHQGRNVYNITAQQIASAAGVGKGTIYDYFSSKEEIIAKAIIYSIENENSLLKEKVDALSSFKEKMYAVYERVLAGFTNSLSSFNLIISIGGTKELLSFLTSGYQSYEQLMEQSTEIFTQILTCGVLEGEILPPRDADYVRMIISANYMAVGKAAMEAHTNGTMDTAKELIMANAYKMLIKSLN